MVGCLQALPPDELLVLRVVMKGYDPTWMNTFRSIELSPVIKYMIGIRETPMK